MNCKLVLSLRLQFFHSPPLLAPWSVVSAAISGLGDLLPQLVNFRAGLLPGVVAEHELQWRLALRSKRHDPDGEQLRIAGWLPLVPSTNARYCAIASAWSGPL